VVFLKLLLHLYEAKPQKIYRNIMPVTLIISVISALILSSMIFSGISYSRQQAMKKRKAQINKYRQQSDEVLTYIDLLQKIDEKYELMLTLQAVSVNNLTAATRLAPNDELLIHNLQTQQNLHQLFKDETRNFEVTCYTTNDNELNQTISQLGQLSKLLDIYKNKNSLSLSKHQALQNHLQALKVHLTINSHLYQADCFAEEDNPTMYQMHIKQALEVLKKSAIEPKTKNQGIKHLSERYNDVKRTNKVVSDKNLIKPSQEATKEEGIDPGTEKKNY